MVVSPAYREAVTIPFVSVLVLVLGLVASAGHAGASNILDYVTFDGVDYIRWPWEPGRSLTRTDLGIEFATIECSLGEDLRGCPYGVDASAAFMPAGTRMYGVRGYATEFRLAAVWKDHMGVTCLLTSRLHTSSKSAVYSTLMPRRTDWLAGQPFSCTPSARSASARLPLGI